MRLSATLSTPTISDVAPRAQWLESLGFERAWVGEGRLRRDAVTTMTLALTGTRRLQVASGIVRSGPGT
jgi:alkanesulfonate monooxygenase SsuD/methylene tetrahydromethanopterin reductase-like flavin-dependent oxidoreductase (luciferase family)